MEQEKRPDWRPIYETSITDVQHPIRPDDVPLNGESSDTSTFGTSEVEQTAGHLIMFFKSRGYWSAFTIDEFRRFHRDHNWDPNLMFYGLMGGYVHASGLCVELLSFDEPMLALETNGKYGVTNIFIERCCRHLKRKAA